MNRRIAIPVFETDVAPRFCFARRFLIAELSKDEVVSRSFVDLGEPGWRPRLALLRRQGVTHVLCGGLNRMYLPSIEGLGIHVSWGHIGEAERLLQRFCTGELGPPIAAPSGARHRPRRGRCNHNGRRGRRGTDGEPRR